MEHLVNAAETVREQPPSAQNVIDPNYMNFLVQQQVQAALNNLNLTRNSLPEFKKKHADMIPIFDGKPEKLRPFLDTCQKIADRFTDVEDEDNFQNEEVLRTILSKIQGPASDMISNLTITDFDEIKKALLETYSDKRDIYTLNHELTALRHREQENPFEFLSRVKDKLNIIVAYLRNHEPALITQNILVVHYQNLALRTLLLYLREPLGSQLRTRQPKSLGEAQSIMTNDFQILSYQKSNFNKQTGKPNQGTYNSGQKTFQNFNKNVKPNQGNASFKTNQNSQYKPNPNNSSQQFRSNPNQTYKPNSYSQTGPNQKPPSGLQPIKSVPMSWQTTNPNFNNVETDDQEEDIEPEEEPNFEEESFLEEGQSTHQEST